MNTVNVTTNNLEDYSCLREQILAAQELKEQPDGSYTCLLNVEFFEECFYNFPYGFLTVTKTALKDNFFSVEAIVHSIDDVSVPMLGPIEHNTEADLRLKKVVEGIKEWEGYLPKTSDLETFCQERGLYLNL